MVRRMDRQGEVLIWCRKCSGFARQRMGPKLMNCCKPEQMGTKECDKQKPNSRGRKGPSQRRQRSWRIEGQKRIITRKEYQRLFKQFRNGRFHGPKKDQGISLLKRCCRIGESYLRKRVTSLENTRLCMKKTSRAAG